MRRLIGVDANVVAHAFADPAKPKTYRCREALARLTEEKVTLLLPSIALSEYMRGVAHEEMAEHLVRLRRNFVIVPFDAEAALLGARVFQACREHCKGQAPAQALRADFMIVGTVLAKGVSFVLADDDHFDTIATHWEGLKVLHVRDVVPQQSLPFVG
jgi:predicted nucleic acid-binding protein